MQPLAGMKSLGPNQVLKLKRRSLYGLKQAHVKFNNVIIDEFIRSIGFKRCTSDPCLYVKRET
jgi:hypothetical protein